MRRAVLRTSGREECWARERSMARRDEMDAGIGKGVRCWLRMSSRQKHHAADVLDLGYAQWPERIPVQLRRGSRQQCPEEGWRFYRVYNEQVGIVLELQRVPHVGVE